MTDHPRYLSRKEAAAWFHRRGLTHVTVPYLGKLADAGRGPDYSRMGRLTYYAEPALEAWLQEQLRPVTRARGKPRDQAA